jgi:hypothetical protein
MLSVTLEGALTGGVVALPGKLRVGAASQLRYLEQLRNVEPEPGCVSNRGLRLSYVHNESKRASEDERT